MLLEYTHAINAGKVGGVFAISSEPVATKGTLETVLGPRAPQSVCGEWLDLVTVIA